MDIFMDKLAQKINAQEIIKANTTAEIQELNGLRSRVAEYNECLDRLQKLVDENAAGLKGASRETTAEIKRLVEESLAKIRAIQQDASGLEKLGGQIGDMKAQVDSVNGKLGNVDGQLGDMKVQVDSINGQLGSMSAQLGAAKGELANKLEQLSVRLEERPDENPGDGLEERFTAVEENVHKECVKVYRNVQAVVMEESGKQGEALAEMSEKLNAMKGRLGIVLGISVTALVFSLAGAVLQLLDLLGIGLL